MSEQEIAYYLTLSAEEINSMLEACSGIEEALEILGKINRVRAWYIYQREGGEQPCVL